MAQLRNRNTGAILESDKVIEQMKIFESQGVSGEHIWRAINQWEDVKTGKTPEEEGYKSPFLNNVPKPATSMEEPINSTEKVAGNALKKQFGRNLLTRFGDFLFKGTQGVVETATRKITGLMPDVQRAEESAAKAAELSQRAGQPLDPRIEISQEILREAVGKNITAKKVVGQLGLATLELAPFLAAGKIAQLGGKAIVSEGGKVFAKTALRRAAVTGGMAAGFGAFSALEEEKETEEILKRALAGGVIGAVGSGIFSMGKYGLYNVTSPKFTSSLFKSGLGFPRNVNKQEERINKSAAEILIKEGPGTVRSLKHKYERLMTGLESDIQKAINKSTVTYKSKDLISQMEKQYASWYDKALSDDQIKARIGRLPLRLLKENKEVTVQEINQLRRTLSNRFLSNTQWLQKAKEGNVDGLKIASSILSEAVKTAAPESRALFERFAAVIKGYDAALNLLSPSLGPLNQNARIVGLLAKGGSGGFLGFKTGGLVGLGLGVGTAVLSQTTVGKTTAAVLLNKLGMAGNKIAGKLTDKQLARLTPLLLRLVGTKLAGEKIAPELVKGQ